MCNFTDQRIKQILACSPAILYTGKLGEPFCLTFVSDNFSSRFGYSAEECLANPGFWRENIHADDCSSVFAGHAELLETGHHIQEYRFRNKAGVYLWLLDERRLIRNPDGSPPEVVGSWLDITDRKAMEDSLLKSEALFRDFFQTNPVPTIISEPSGKIHMVNPAFAENSGYSAQEVVGPTAQELGFWRNPADRDRMVAAIRECGYINSLESTFYGKGERLMTCLISSRAVEFDGELRILSIVNDVTEKRKAEESLRQLNQAKSDFISTAAHELRTPLVAIIGYSELLENVGSNSLTVEERESYLAIIQSNAEILNRLVDDLLDVGRIQIGRSLGILPQENDLAGIIKCVAASLSVKNSRHNIVITHDSTLPDTLWIDGDRITQVLNNLLSNAIKYSPLGGTIHVKTSTGADKVTISVADQGQGMTPQQIEHVFDRFYRAESAGLAISGLGLGMAIVRQIVVDHSGEVFVDSCLGEGTVVTFTLPTGRQELPA